MVAPPYDVIGPALQDRLYDASPYNVIRLELNREEPGDADGAEPLHAAPPGFLQGLAARRASSREDPHPRAVRLPPGVRGRGPARTPARASSPASGWSRSAQGRIYPHEQTLSGPKADRLDLYHATGLQPQPDLRPLPRPRERGARGRRGGHRRPHAAGGDRPPGRRQPAVAGHRPAGAHRRVQGLMGPKPVFIADGHHRYETGLKYRDERPPRGELTGPDDPANFCLMMLVGMSDPGLLILPTHRLVSGFPGLTSDDPGRAARPRVRRRATSGEGDAGGRAAWERDRGRRRPGRPRLRHRRRRPLADRPAPLRRDDGRARPRPQRPTGGRSA